ncbi:MAG: hypothetical protein ACLQUY_14165 [Ktedonobacterales bacterium]
MSWRSSASDHRADLPHLESPDDVADPVEQQPDPGEDQQEIRHEDLQN